VIDDLFGLALLSYPLGIRKPAPLSYDLVLTAAGGYAARQVLFCVDNCTTTSPPRSRTARARCWSVGAGCGQGKRSRTARR
jgi:hypothetical protein